MEGGGGEKDAHADLRRASGTVSQPGTFGKSEARQAARRSEAASEVRA